MTPCKLIPVKEVLKMLQLKELTFTIESNNNKLPIKIKGTIYPTPINYFESKASAQVKSCILLAAMKTSGITNIKSFPSRDHTERFFYSAKIERNWLFRRLYTTRLDNF